MATKSQRKAEKAKRRAKKEREKQRHQGTAAKRLELRLAKQEARAMVDEMVEDVALFNDHVLAGLDAELQQQAVLVRRALQGICDSSGIDSPVDASSEVLDSLAVISRRSPYAQWRLFLRGLVDWFDKDWDSASEVWSRLDPVRRPARIAISLLLSLQEDLESSGNASKSMTERLSSQCGWFGEIDPELIAHAKLVRKHQLDRVSIRTAQKVTQIRIPDELKVGIEHIDWLRKFTDEFARIEPELVQSLHETLILLAYHQNYDDIFKSATKHFRGPQHDRNNNLCRFQFEQKFEGPSDTERYLNNYLVIDLPKNTELTQQLRNAIASELHLQISRESSSGPLDFLQSLSFFRFDPGIVEVRQETKQHLLDAVKAYPQNREAWKELVEFVKASLGERRLTKPKQAKIMDELAKLYQSWSEALPDDLYPRTELVDYLLENDQSDAAHKQVQWLAGTRRDDPLADAMLWRWDLLEAMRLCRRKSDASDADALLDDAAGRWPKWLDNQWLPYLRAAVKLRCGESQAFDALKKKERSKNQTLDACMILGAAQRMRAPATSLKPLRDTVQKALDNIKQISVEDLIELGSFYWDLERSRLKYSAFRLHGPKFMEELLSRLSNEGMLVKGRLSSPFLRGALLSIACESPLAAKLTDNRNETIFGLDVYNLPATLAIAVAVAVERDQRRYLSPRFVPDLIEQLQQEASDQDRFYSYFFNQTAQALLDRPGVSGMSMLERIFS